MTDIMTINGKTLDEIHAEMQDESEVDARIERWHNGYFAHRDGKPRPVDNDAAQGWDHRANDMMTQVVMPVRPEGYYHMPLDTFD